MSERRGRVIKCDELEATEGVFSAFSAVDRAPGERGVAVKAPQEPEAPEVERVRRLVQAMLSGFAQQRRELLTELQPYVVRVAVEVARRVVRRELEGDPGMIARTVGSALEQVAGASQVRVRVHPLDAQVLQGTIRELVTTPERAAAVEIVPDGAVEPGGCVVESDRGIVDARLQTQFEEMQARLLDSLETHRARGGHEA